MNHSFPRDRPVEIVFCSSSGLIFISQYQAQRLTQDGCSVSVCPSNTSVFAGVSGLPAFLGWGHTLQEAPEPRRPGRCVLAALNGNYAFVPGLDPCGFGGSTRSHPHTVPFLLSSWKSQKHRKMVSLQGREFTCCFEITYLRKLPVHFMF